MQSQFKKTATAFVAPAVVALVAIHPAHAAGDKEDHDKQPNTALKAARLHGRIFDRHAERHRRNKFVLTPSHIAQGPKIVLTGPVSGKEGGEERHEEAKAGTGKAAEEEGPHGGHYFGIQKRVGTFSSIGDSI